MSTFYDLPPVGESVTLITHLTVREDAWILYGFLREEDCTLFRNLLKVSGVGARMALAILSGMDAQRFALCVRQENIAALTRLPGIGKKTAQRLVIEMRDRVDAMPAGSPAGIAAGSPVGGDGNSALTDAVDALTALGYRPADAVDVEHEPWWMLGDDLATQPADHGCKSLQDAVALRRAGMPMEWA